MPRLRRFAQPHFGNDGAFGANGVIELLDFPADRQYPRRPPAPRRCRLSSAPSCAAESMPRAMPDAIAKPAAVKSCARVKANLRARAEALRAPTIATISRLQKTAHVPAPRSRAAADQAPPALAEIPARKPRSNARPAAAARRFRARPLLPAAARNFSSDPPRAARRGNSASAAPALPNRAIRLAKVTGPTFSVRASLSQASRSLSSSVRAICLLGSDARFLARPAGGGYFPGA